MKYPIVELVPAKRPKSPIAAYCTSVRIAKDYATLTFRCDANKSDWLKCDVIPADSLYHYDETGKHEVTIEQLKAILEEGGK